MSLSINDQGRAIVDGRDLGAAFDLSEQRTIPAGDLHAALIEAFTAIRVAAEARCKAILDAVADPTKTKEDIDAEAKKSERQRHIDALTEAKKKAEQEAADRQAEIDALSREDGAIDVGGIVETP